MRIDPDTCRDPDLLAAEVRRLRAAIDALADQDATLSVCDGNVTVTMDATLTDAERAALEFFGAMEWPAQSQQIKARSGTIRALLKRLGDKT